MQANNTPPRTSKHASISDALLHTREKRPEKIHEPPSLPHLSLAGDLFPELIVEQELALFDVPDHLVLASVVERGIPH